MKTLSFFLALFLSAIIMISLFEYVAFDNEFYSEQFKKRATLEHISEAWMLHQNILSFHKGNNDVDLNYLSHEEISHLLDVKQLYHFLIYLKGILSLLSLGIVYLFTSRYRENLFQLLALSCAYCAMVGWLFFLSFLIVLDSHFADLFHTMHVYLFPSNSYSFDVGDLLVNLYPQALFFEMIKRFIFIGLGIFSLLLILGMPAFILKNYSTIDDKTPSSSSIKLTKEN